MLAWDDFLRRRIKICPRCWGTAQNRKLVTGPDVQGATRQFLCQDQIHGPRTIPPKGMGFDSDGNPFAIPF